MPISRSVATNPTPSCFVSNRMLERTGMVLRFSTIPWTRCSPVNNSSLAILIFIGLPPLGLLGAHDLSLQFLERAEHAGIAQLGLLHLLAGMHDGRVILSAEVPRDLRIGLLRDLPTQVHRDLPRIDQRLRPAL